MTTSSARLMLFARAQEVLGTQEAEVLMDMLTPGEALSESKRSTDPFIQGFCEDIRLEIREAEARLMKQIDKRITRMAFGFGIPFVVTNIALVASVFYR